MTLRPFALLGLTTSLLSCVSAEVSSPRLPEKLLLHLLLKLENPNAADAPGEQSMVHRLYLVDLSRNRVLGSSGAAPLVACSRTWPSDTQRTGSPGRRPAA
jgi:hypothetical protein